MDDRIGRLLVWGPSLAVGMAMVFALAVLLGFLPAMPFLALTILLLSVGLLALLIRHARLEEHLHGRGLPSSPWKGLERRLHALERQVAELIEREEKGQSRTPASHTSERPAASARLAQLKERAGRQRPAAGPSSATADRRKRSASSRPPSARWPLAAMKAPANGSSHLKASGRSPAGQARPLTAAAEEAMAGFALFMEPVIDRLEHRTVLYRALPALASEDGRMHMGAEAQLRAARLGLSTRLDDQLLSAALAFLKHLMRTGQGVSVLVPLTTSFLLSASARERLQRLLENHEPGHGLVLEIPHEALVSGGERLVRLLAWLAAKGVEMSLGQANPCRMDAPSLTALGFAWMDMPMAMLQDAQARGCRLPLRPRPVVAGVDSERLEALLPAAVRYVRGHLYAPPRRVRDEIWQKPAEVSRDRAVSHAA